MFVGRERELDQLETAYATGTFQCIIVYGRRRVGKTSLITRFISDKPNAHLFTAQQTLAQDNLERLSASITSCAPCNIDGVSSIQSAFGILLADNQHPIYRSYEDALRALFERSRSERTIFVIDEYPYLAASYKGFSSLLQSYIDQYKGTSKLFLVLCGSSMSFMEHQVLGEKSPLYGRRTGQIALQPFDAFDAARLLDTKDPVRAVELYAIAGGVPLYLEQLDAAHDTEWNIAQRVLQKGAFLEAEPHNFLSQEVRSPATYNAVISAIAEGHTRASEIASRTQRDSASIQPYLKTLEELCVIRKVIPVTSKKKQQTRYVIADNLFAFWYRFGVRYATAIDAGMAATVANIIMKQEFPTFVGPIFETICRQWLIRQMQNGTIPLLPKAIGSWWGTNPHEKRQEEIDVVVEGADGTVLLGECKWRNEPVDADVLSLLIERGQLIDSSDKRYMLFSKAGFTAACRTSATQRNDVRLVTLEELFDPQTA